MGDRVVGEAEPVPTWGRRSSPGGSWKSPSLRPHRGERRGALPLKKRVDSAMHGTLLRRRRHQSLPGRAPPGLPAVGHRAGAVALVEVVPVQKYMSLQSTTTPPCSRAARSKACPDVARVGHRLAVRAAGDAAVGAIVSRTWVMRAAGSRDEVTCAAQAVLAPSSFRSAGEFLHGRIAVVRATFGQHSTGSCR
jgi:hypothetical protein